MDLDRVRERETQWLLKWVLEELERSVDADVGRPLEDIYLRDSMTGTVIRSRFARAVALSGYRNRKDREAAPCQHNEYVASIHPDEEGRIFECWGCGARSRGGPSPREWSEVF